MHVDQPQRNNSGAGLCAPPFFIVGCLRSGTTLLQRMLDAHPEVAFAPDMLRFHEFAMHGLDLTREPWKAGAARALEKAPADRWHTRLDAARIRAVEAVAWPEMCRWGYAPETPLPILAAAVAGAGIADIHLRLRRKTGCVWP